MRRYDVVVQVRFYSPPYTPWITIWNYGYNKMYERNNKFTRRKWKKKALNKLLETNQKTYMWFGTFYSFHLRIFLCLFFFWRIKRRHWYASLCVRTARTPRKINLFQFSKRNFCLAIWVAQILSVYSPLGDCHHRHLFGFFFIHSQQFEIYLLLDIHFRELLWQSKEWMNGSGEKITKYLYCLYMVFIIEF